MAEMILPQTLLCSGIVFALESEIPGLNLELELTRHSALQLATRMSRKNPCCNLCGYIFHHRLWCLLWHKCETDASGFDYGIVKPGPPSPLVVVGETYVCTSVSG